MSRHNSQGKRVRDEDESVRGNSDSHSKKARNNDVADTGKSFRHSHSVAKLVPAGQTTRAPTELLPASESASVPVEDSSNISNERLPVSPLRHTLSKFFSATQTAQANDSKEGEIREDCEIIKDVPLVAARNTQPLTTITAPSSPRKTIIISIGADSDSDSEDDIPVLLSSDLPHTPPQTSSSQTQDQLNFARDLGQKLSQISVPTKLDPASFKPDWSLINVNFCNSGISWEVLRVTTFDKVVNDPECFWAHVLCAFPEIGRNNIKHVVLRVLVTKEGDKEVRIMSGEPDDYREMVDMVQGHARMLRMQEGGVEQRFEVEVYSLLE